MGYIFDPQRLQEIGSRAVGLPFEQMVQTVLDQVAEAYPGHTETKQEWVFSLAGGITGIMTVIHGSLSEYVLIFGTPIGSEGFSGRYHIDIWDVVLSGQMSTYTEDRPGELVLHKPGELAYLKRGKTKAAKFTEHCWLLEYGRGPIATSLPMALGDAVFSALDATILVKTFRIYGRLVLRELLKGKI